MSILLCHPHQQEVLLLQEQVRTILSSNQTPNSILSLLNFFFFSSVTRSASTATAAWQVFCLWSLQRFQQGLNVHRWKLFSIWNLIFFNCTNYTSSLISGWLWLHESSVSKSGDWRDDPELWARGDNALIFNCQHLTPEIFDQWCSPKQVNCKYYHDGCMVTGLRSTMEEHEERYAHRNEKKIISIAAKWYNWYYILYIIIIDIIP